eukprot:Nitzschia sp. Nitz4//scaffold15_size197535//101758//103941//NITZ4_001584-RA/size197535-augustus-gene-0.226-mRNA-1//-1//CDS//3329537733//1241//frame0
MANFLDHVRIRSGMVPSDSDDEFSFGEMHDARTFSSVRTPRSNQAMESQATKNTTTAAASNDTESTDQENYPWTEQDIELCQRLDEEYERALEEREIGYNARYTSVRQSALLSVIFIILFLGLGTVFFMRQTPWDASESLLFCIFTITTVGYGHEEIPTSPGFQAYSIFYILVGIAALTIMVAQVYQCVALEAARAQHARDKTQIAERGLDSILNKRQRNPQGTSGTVRTAGADEIVLDTSNSQSILDRIFRCLDHARDFFRTNELGRGFSVLFPLAGLVLVGALVVGPIEGWTFLEALYFAIVSLTTVGFGDYVPTRNISIYFCILWLPFSVGFMSIYLGNVAAFYIRLSDRNIQRIERHMRRRLQRAKDRAELEKAEVLKRAYRGQEAEVAAAAAKAKNSKDAKKDETDHPGEIPLKHAQSLAAKNNPDGFDALPTGDSDNSERDGSDSHSLFGSSPVKSGLQRRQQIIENGQSPLDRPEGGSRIQSMRDIVRAVRQNLQAPPEKASLLRRGPDVQFMSIRSTQTITTHHGVLRRVQTRKPSFGLRVLVQERLAEIIATDIAGYHSAIAIQDTTLSVTMDCLKDVADKWLIPRRARKAFRAVAFESLYFVGEHGLVTRGADALFELSPLEFHGLFSSLVAAMGDADTMEGWLSSTNVLAEADLVRDGRVGQTPKKLESQMLSALSHIEDETIPEDTVMISSSDAVV